MKFIFFLSLPLYALDQLTKYYVLRLIKPDEPRVVIAGWFDLVNITNTGAAFGSFKNNNTFFIVISGLALLFVVALLVRRRSWDIWRDVSLALLAAGGLISIFPTRIHGRRLMWPIRVLVSRSFVSSFIRFDKTKAPRSLRKSES